jgi:hypothetical protein
MVGRRGIIRILEAVFAVLIILSVLILVAVNRGERNEADLTELIPPILDEIAKDEVFRGRILNGDAGIDTDLEDFVRERVRPGLNVKVKICDPLVFCELSGNFPEGADALYAGERIISTTLGSTAPPKKVKIFLWR